MTENKKITDAELTKALSRISRELEECEQLGITVVHVLTSDLRIIHEVALRISEIGQFSVKVKSISLVPDSDDEEMTENDFPTWPARPGVLE